MYGDWWSEAMIFHGDGRVDRGMNLGRDGRNEARGDGRVGEVWILVGDGKNADNKRTNFANFKTS